MLGIWEGPKTGCQVNRGWSRHQQRLGHAYHEGSTWGVTAPLDTEALGFNADILGCAAMLALGALVKPGIWFSYGDDFAISGCERRYLCKEFRRVLGLARLYSRLLRFSNTTVMHVGRYNPLTHPPPLPPPSPGLIRPTLAPA